MASQAKSRLPELLEKNEKSLLIDWVREQTSLLPRQKLQIPEERIREDSAEFLRLFVEAARSSDLSDTSQPNWAPVRDLLTSLSRERTQRGCTPSETATFILSLKSPIFARLRIELSSADELANEIWMATQVLDQLGLFTTEVHQKAREEVILRQQQEMMELSTPVVKLWEGILALPLIGTLDSARTQVVMESLLQRIVETGSTVAIIDITGVPTVDTLVAQHLLKAVTAARLMGADCIISGIRPQIAQTIVHLGVELGDVTTKAGLADAFRLALQRTGVRLDRNAVADKAEFL